MPITISRLASVYRLWDNDDLRECFADHAAVGWVCSLAAYREGDTVVWSVGLQNNASRVQLTAGLGDVVVSDLVTVEALSVAVYNAAHPDDMVEELGS